MTEIAIANTVLDFKLIAKLANNIWREHYTPIIGVDQVEYMLTKFQSVNAISNQVKQGFEYYIINYENISVGYLSVIKEKDSLFLSKIYVLSNYRGKKIGKTAMIFVEDKAKQLNCNKIKLTVNKNNSTSIAAYEKIGFKNLGPIVKDIGRGFNMDDYKMEKYI